MKTKAKKKLSLRIEGLENAYYQHLVNEHNYVGIVNDDGSLTLHPPSVAHPESVPEPEPVTRPAPRARAKKSVN